METHKKTHISIQIYMLKAKTGQKRSKKQAQSKPEGADAYLTIVIS